MLFSYSCRGLFHFALFSSRGGFLTAVVFLPTGLGVLLDVPEAGTQCVAAGGELTLVLPLGLAWPGLQEELREPGQRTGQRSSRPGLCRQSADSWFLLPSLPLCACVCVFVCLSVSLNALF